jgi:hypothetical protein
MLNTGCSDLAIDLNRGECGEATTLLTDQICSRHLRYFRIIVSSLLLFCVESFIGTYFVVKSVIAVWWLAVGLRAFRP